MCPSHTHMSLSQGVKRSRPSLLLLLLLLPPPPPPVCRKKNLFSIEIARPISAYFCFEREGKHLLKNWVTKELWVLRAKSQPHWCSHVFLFSYSSSRSGQAEVFSLICTWMRCVPFGIFRRFKVRSFWWKKKKTTNVWSDFQIPVWLKIQCVCNLLPVLQIKRKEASCSETYDALERLDTINQQLLEMITHKYICDLW